MCLINTLKNMMYNFVLFLSGVSQMAIAVGIVMSMMTLIAVLFLRE